MSSVDDDNQRKGTVEVGSGDFQPNPIYGDQPQSYATTYDENDPNQMNNAQQDEYPKNPDEQEYEDDDDANNPFNEQQPQQQQQQQQQQYDEYNQYDDTPQQQQEEQQNPPPPYSEDPPAPPAYSDQNQQEYDNEPEDVVAQMNMDNNTNNDMDEDVGDYGVTQPKTEDNITDGDDENGQGLFGNFFIRTVYIASAILFCTMLSFDIWFREVGGDFSAGYGLSGFAAFMLFLGSIGAIIYAILKKMGRPIPAEKIVLYVIIAFYGIGGLFYFLGGCAVAYAWNEASQDSIAGIFFAEQTFVGLHGLLAGIDLWRRKFLNNKKWRVIIYNILFLFVAVVAFFAYAVTSTKVDEAGGDNAGPAFLALWYFVAIIPEILYLVIFLIPKLNETLGKPIIYLICAGVFLLSVICILIGYFIIVGQFDGVNGRAYFLGVGFFILLTGTIISFDMLFDRFIPGYKDGGQSVADQDATSGPAQIATDNPDSD